MKKIIKSVYYKLVYKLSRQRPLDSNYYFHKYPDVVASGISAYEHYLKFGAGEGRIRSYEEEFEREKNSEEVPLSGNKNFFVIVSTKHTEYVAKLIGKVLDSYNLSYLIFDRVPEDVCYADKCHIILCPQMFDNLPRKYIAFQFEQTINKRWFDNSYVSKLKNAVAIMDYSRRNLNFLINLGISYKRVFYVPIWTNKVLSGSAYKENNLTEDDYKYDILFFGDDSSARRKKILNLLGSEFKVKVINNNFSEELVTAINQSKIVLNIHYYEPSLLETTRIMDCLGRGKVVVSERSLDSDDFIFKDLVYFVNSGDESGLLLKVRNLLSKLDFKKEETKIIDAVSKSYDYFSFYLSRLLLAYDVIDFEQFYDVVGRDFTLTSNYVCLSLPETPHRRQAFVSKEIASEFQIFDGLRHSIGWVGCGLSYKFLLKKAQELNLNQIIICEDDVVFPEDFKSRFKNIMSYLDGRTDWNIFAGVIADFNPKTTIQSVEFKNRECFVTIDKMVSMVFNVYDKSCYRFLERWNANKRHTSNTIDRYIEAEDQLTVITTADFLVGHEEELMSSLWDHGNETYTAMIDNSSRLLAKKTLSFITKANCSSPN
jgi:hypothetical protein